MANTIKIRRSATAAAVPTTTQLALGELAVNTTDGKLFLKKDVSGTESIVEVGALTAGSIVDSNISASAEIAVSKLADGAARELLQTDAAGTGVEWASNIDIPGTLDVTSAATFDSTVSIPLGAAATPSLYFGADTNTGIYSPGADQVAVSTGGVQRVNVTNGTTSFGGPTGDTGVEIGAGATGNRSAYVDLVGDTTYTDYGTRLIRYNTGANANSALEHRGTGQLQLQGTDNGPIVFLRGGSAESARIDSSGRLLVGTSSAIANASATQAGEQLHGTGAEFSTKALFRWSNDNGRPVISFSKSRGASVGTRGVVQSNDLLAVLSFEGDDGTNFIRAANITATVDGTPGANDMPGRLVFSTTADGAASPTERMVIKADGNVGIGTSTPSAKLTTQGISGTYPTTEIRHSVLETEGEILRIGRTDSTLRYHSITAQQSATAGGADNYLAFKIHNTVSTTAQTEVLRLTGNGRVGIGTTSPAAAIDAVAESSLALGLRIRGRASDDNGIIQFTNNAASAQTAAITGTSTSSLVFTAGSTERARIDSSGRLLVGTSSNYTIGDSSAWLMQLGNSAGISNIRAGNNASPSYLVLAKTRATSAGSFAILQNNDLIGDISFAADDGTDYATNAAKIHCAVDGTPGANDMPGRLVFSTTADGASSPTERMRITANGDVLFSTNTIASITSATANANAWSETTAAKISSRTVTTVANHYIFYNPNGNVGSIQTNGSSTSYNTSSDYRLKENVTPVTDGITRLQQLKPSRFNFIADPAKTVDGFIAHEAQAVVPECVTGEKDAVDADGNPIYQGIDQSKLVPLLTAALQEAIAKIETLEAKVAVLESA